VLGERVKLEQASADLGTVHSVSEESRPDLLRKLIRDYRNLVADQRTIDAHVQYNRFWQRAIATDRSRFDQMTQVYDLLQQNNADLSRVIREALGTPEVPAFIAVDQSNKNSVVLRVPVYTDIEDDSFLEAVKTSIESFWQATDSGVQYRLELELRKRTARQIYNDGEVPERGAHLDLRVHAARFPADGAVLTSGAQTTYALVGRFIALSSGEVSFRSVAHEFGHVLGFRDGYVRGYKDLGKDGLEILELTPNFDDLMSAPRQGNVQAAHFKLLLANLRTNR
jgi:hypothetical protein